MKIGIGGNASSLQGIVSEAKRSEEARFSTYSISNVLGHDAIGAQTVAAVHTAEIELLTAVVPVLPRHPVALAQQALTAQAAARGRFTLGIGLSHKVMMERSFGLTYDPAAKRMEEYLEALLPLLRGEKVNTEGNFVSARAQVTATDQLETRCLLAALGPRMLELAGKYTDGTILWLTGGRAIRNYIRPHILRSVTSSGRPSPRIVCGLPIVLTNKVEEAREKAEGLWGRYASLPSYAWVLQQQGARRSGDVVLAGDEGKLVEALDELCDTGVTSFLGTPFASDADAIDRTWSFLAANADRWSG